MDLLKKLTELKEQQKRIEADFHAISGAIQFCEQLIKEQEGKDADESN